MKGHARAGINIGGMVLCAAVLLSCASPPPAAPTPGSATPAAPAAAKAPRKLPRAQFVSGIDWYPLKAKQSGISGRVLIGFTIDGNGKAASMKVLKAEAPRILRSAALDFVSDMRFDVTDPIFDASDPAPFAMSVRFCIVECGALVGYTGYEDIRITGLPLSPLGR